MRGRAPVLRFRDAAETVRDPGNDHASALRVFPAASDSQGVSCPLARGPYQDNGATPWMTALSLGSPGQNLKFALDTGSNFIWTNSTLCKSAPDQQPGGGCFDYAKSTSFSWINQSDSDEDFGPWGTMTVELGEDVLGMTPSLGVCSPFYLAKSYSGSQFSLLDWAGGIGLPAGSDFADPDMPLIVASLMNTGGLDPEYPYISFEMDPASGKGMCRFGPLDPSRFDPQSGIFMRWSPYLEISNVQYIWSTALAQYRVGDTLVAADVMFCLDSGSSQFKGDNDIMVRTLTLVGQDKKPDIHLHLGTTGDGQMGKITVPPEVYMVEIQAGPGAGKTLPQFNPLGMTDLVLVGSVVMEHVVTVYEYDVTRTAEGYHLAPVGMWMFNKHGGWQLICSKAGEPVSVLGKKAVHEARPGNPEK